MNDNLKPCPFCGGNPSFYQIFSNGRNVWKVMCGKSVDCCAILNEFDTKEQAIDAWNNRKSQPENINSELLNIVSSYAESLNCVECTKRKNYARNIVKNIKTTPKGTIPNELSN